jgi:hypothetical protein
MAEWFHQGIGVREPHEYKAAPNHYCYTVATLFARTRSKRTPTSGCKLYRQYNMSEKSARACLGQDSATQEPVEDFFVFYALT